MSVYPTVKHFVLLKLHPYGKKIYLSTRNNCYILHQIFRDQPKVSAMIQNELLTKRDACRVCNTWGGICPEAENTIGKPKSSYAHVAGPTLHQPCIPYCFPQQPEDKTRYLLPNNLECTNNMVSFT